MSEELEMFLPVNEHGHAYSVLQLIGGSNRTIGGPSATGGSSSGELIRNATAEGNDTEIVDEAVPPTLEDTTKEPTAPLQAAANVSKATLETATNETKATLETSVNETKATSETAAKEIKEANQSRPDEWESPMFFDMHVGWDAATKWETINIDVCSFISRAPELDHIFGDYAFFDRKQYPPLRMPPAMESDGVASLHNKNSPFHKLRLAFMDKARENGFTLVMNGDINRRKQSKSSHFPLGSGPVWASRTLTCNRFNKFKNKYAPGQPRKRRRTSQKALTSEETCNFGLTVFINQCGFYVQRTRTNKKIIHCHHEKLLPSQIKLRREQIEAAEDKKRAALAHEFLTGAKAEMREIEQLLLAGQNKMDLVPCLEYLRKVRKQIQNGDTQITDDNDNSKGKPESTS